MNKLIRRIIKEEIDEFDWVEPIGESDFFTMLDKFFKEKHPEYWFEEYEHKPGYNLTVLRDEKGSYLRFHKEELNVKFLRDYLLEIIESYKGDDSENKREYIQLAKALEPFIGPIGYSLNESDEFDWIETMEEPNFFTLVDQLFKNKHPRYKIELVDDETSIDITDDTGIYYTIPKNIFSEEVLRNHLRDTIKRLSRDKKGEYNEVRNDYIRLAKALEPLIGTINSNINESDELDWVESIEEPNFFIRFEHFLKTQHPEYKTKQSHIELDFHLMDTNDDGIYYTFRKNDFSEEVLRHKLRNTLMRLANGETKREYTQLAKALEPLIGPIDIPE